MLDSVKVPRGRREHYINIIERKTHWLSRNQNQHFLWF